MKYESYCRCGIKFAPDNRHVSESGAVESCKPSNNLEYLEYLNERKDKLNKLSQTERP